MPIKHVNNESAEGVLNTFVPILDYNSHILMSILMMSFPCFTYFISKKNMVVWDVMNVCVGELIPTKLLPATKSYFALERKSKKFHKQCLQKEFELQREKESSFEYQECGNI